MSGFSRRSEALLIRRRVRTNNICDEDASDGRLMLLRLRHDVLKVRAGMTIFFRNLGHSAPAAKKVPSFSEVFF